MSHSQSEKEDIIKKWFLRRCLCILHNFIPKSDNSHHWHPIPHYDYDFDFDCSPNYASSAPWRWSRPVPPGWFWCSHWNNHFLIIILIIIIIIIIIIVIIITSIISLIITIKITIKTWMAATAFSWSVESRRTPSTSTILSLVLKPPALIVFIVYSHWIDDDDDDDGDADDDYDDGDDDYDGGMMMTMTMAMMVTVMLMMTMTMAMVRTIMMMMIGTCQQDCQEEHSWWRFPSRFVAEAPPFRWRWKLQWWFLWGWQWLMQLIQRFTYFW